MRNINKAVTACGFAIAVMTSALFTPPALAFNVTEPFSAPESVSPEPRPPQITPAQSEQPLSKPQETAHVLGTLPAGEAPDVAPPALTPPDAPTEALAAAAPMVTPASDTAAAAAPADAGPQPQKSGDVTYVTGGVGDEERKALEAGQKDYNLRVMNASASGAFVADVRLVIRDNKGKELLDAISGPLLYASLPSGSYTLEATGENRTKKQNVTIGKNKASIVHFNW